MNPQLGITYDVGGNLTAIGGFAFAYDAENRLVSSTLNSVTTNYVYDGEGRRVKKGPVVMVCDAFGRLAAEYGGTADPVGTEYLTADHLGSTRLVTSSTGAAEKPAGADEASREVKVHGWGAWHRVIYAAGLRGFPHAQFDA